MSEFYCSPSFFWRERQNNPAGEKPSDQAELVPSEIAGRVNGLARGVVPLDGEVLVGHVDVHDRLLYWMVTAIARKSSRGGDRGLRHVSQQPSPAFLAAGLPAAADLRTGDGGSTESGRAQGMETLTPQLVARRVATGGRRGDAAGASWSTRATTRKSCGKPAGDGVRARSRCPPAARACGPATRRWTSGRSTAAKWPATIGGSGFQRGRDYLFVDAAGEAPARRGIAGPGQGSPGDLTIFGRDPAAHRLLAEHLSAERHRRDGPGPHGPRVRAQDGRAGWRLVGHSRRLLRRRGRAEDEALLGRAPRSAPAAERREDRRRAWGRCGKGKELEVRS